MRTLKFCKLVLVFLIVSQFAFAQQGINWNSPLPIDNKVIIGKLENGMTYYIRKNAEPKERAEFYIVHNVGAILENDDQDGLAHFAEHMAFNGTKNFPDKGILNFLENIGVKFGHNVNAFTAQDMTAYNLSNVPLRREGIIDSALLILHDWSSYISFEDAEIDAERGVITEEWRTRRTSDFRARNEKSKVLLGDSKYAKRDVIGSLDVIQKHKYETLRKFYQDWYRPDLQALIIVGDFDPAMMEQKVKERFSKIPARENRQPVPEFEVPDHKETRYGVFTDPEITRTMVEIYFKHPVVPKDQKNLGYYRKQLVERLYTQMINARFDELVQKDNPPFVMAYSYYSGITRTKSAYVIAANARENETERATKTMLEENYRLLQHGFTQTELDRAKADLLRSVENSYKERDKVRNENLIWEYFGHFTENEPIPGAEFDYQFSNAMVPSISLAEMNELVKKWITDENMVIFITAPEKEKEKIPGKEKLLAIYENVKNSKLDAYIDNVKTEPLIATAPKAGKVSKETQNKVLSATEWQLSNGIKVILKPTDFKEDEVLLSAYSPGGFSLVADKDVPSAQMTTSIAMMSGLGNHNKIDLDKALSGKIVSVSPYISEYEEGFNGSASPQNIEELFQLVYLYFTNPRFEESSFNAYMTRIQAVLQNAGNNPNMIFRDSTSFITSSRHNRRRPMNINLLKEVNFNTIKSIYADRFADASDFTFILVGNIDPVKVKPLVETYLASLPNKKRKEKFKDNNIRFPKGNVEYPFTVSMQVPKSSCFVAYQGVAPYNFKNRLYMDAVDHALSLRYTETIREKEGGTYGVASRANLVKYPVNLAWVNMNFDTDPAKAKHLVGIIHSEFKKILDEGPTEADLIKAREYFLKTRQENLRNNRFWSSAIRDLYSNGIDVLTGYENAVKSLNSSEIQKAVKEFFKNADTLEIIMSPAN